MGDFCKWYSENFQHTRGRYNVRDRLGTQWRRLQRGYTMPAMRTSDEEFDLEVIAAYKVYNQAEDAATKAYDQLMISATQALSKALIAADGAHK